MEKELLSKEEIIILSIPADCYWQDNKSLINCPIRYIEKAMETHSQQQSIAFNEWIVRRDDIVPRLENETVIWYYTKSGEVVCSGTENLYTLFIQSQSNPNP